MTTAKDQGLERFQKTEVSLMEAHTHQSVMEYEKAKWELEREQLVAHRQDSSASYNGSYMFFDDVTGRSVAFAMSVLSEMSRRSPGCDIEIIFNSPGGYVTDGLGLYDFIRDLSLRGHKVTTVAVGMAASMGAILLQAGDERIMTANSFILIHETGGYVGGKIAEIKDMQKFMGMLDDRCVSILAERSTLSKTQIKNRSKKFDWYLSAAQAKDFGFIDSVR